MKRTISLEAAAAVAHLRNLGFNPVCQPPNVGGASPFVTLGIATDARWPEVRQAFLTRLRQFHPERNPEEFVLVVDAYDSLKRHFREVELAEQARAVENPHVKRRRGCEESHVIPGAVVSAPVAYNSPARTIIALDSSGIAHFNGNAETAETQKFAVNNAASSPAPMEGLAVNNGIATNMGCGIFAKNPANSNVQGFSRLGFPSVPAADTSTLPKRCFAAEGGDGAAMCIG